VKQALVILFMWYVYIIKSIGTDFTYIGSARDLKKRFAEHNEGLSKATKPYKPYELLAYIAVQSEAQARELEQYFKTGSGKAILYKRILGRKSANLSDEALA
jgi:predicted GIY-YIG superfamily endonuclease